MGFLANITAALSANGGADFAWPNRLLGPGALKPDYERVSDYHRYTHIYFGRFANAFPNDDNFANLPGKNGSVTTYANLAARCVDALQSAVWVESPDAHCTDARLQSFSKDLLHTGSTDQTVAKNVRDTILYGDGVLKVEIENDAVKVRSLHPTVYFPELRVECPEDPLAHNVVFAEDPLTISSYRRERYWYNDETETWWLTVTRFDAQSGRESLPLVPPIDLLVRYSPIIHTYGEQVSGIFWGKAPLSDCERMVGEYAATINKISRITDMASTKALLAAPESAFDEKNNLRWSTGRPLMVDQQDLATFDKNKLGWLTPPGTTLIEPNLSVMTALSKDIYATFGLTPAIFGETGNIRDVGAPGLERVNLLMQFTVARYQRGYSIFMQDLLNVAAAFARNWLGTDLPDQPMPVEFVWPAFAPESESEKADTLIKKQALGVPKEQLLTEMGYGNAADLAAQSTTEQAQTLVVPHVSSNDNFVSPPYSEGEK